MLEQLSGGGNAMFSYGLGERILMEDIQDRIFYLDTLITPDTFREITMFIVKVNAADVDIPVEERVPIKLVINSPGGSVLDGLGLVDAIKASKTPVIAITIGYACSMAFVIQTVCDLRIATQNAVFLNHDGETGLVDSAMKFRDAVKFYDRVDERIDKMIAARTKLTPKELADTKRIEQYWFADEAKDLGIIDYIIGQDIGFDDIFGYSDECDCEECHGKEEA